MQNTSNGNVGKRWTYEENDQLLKLYNDDKLDVNQIATIHGRKAGGIASRLVILKVVEDISAVRGYNASPEYKQKLDEKIKGVSTPTVSTPTVCHECEALKEIIKELKRENEGLRTDIQTINKVLETVTKIL